MKSAAFGMHDTLRVPHILLAQRNSVERYPPVLNQAQLLSKSAEITVLDAPAAENSSELLTAMGVRRLRVPTNSAPGVRGRFARSIGLVQFGAAFRRLYREDPDVTIAYEPEAVRLLLARKGHGRTLRVAHLHETLETDRVSKSTALRRSTRYVIQHLREADLVVVPDAHRADLLVDQAELTTRPKVVMNCPLLLDRLPESRLLPFLRERGAPTSRVVHYQGAIGRDHALDRVIACMPAWPADAVLVLVGAGPHAYLEYLRTIAGQAGVADRVFFVGRVPYDQLFSYAVGSSVGLTLLEPTCENWRYAAGASNKRFEYAALGVPQVTNTGPGIDSLFLRTGLGEAVCPNDAEGIGRAIRIYLCDGERAAQTGHRARQMHLTSYNYEAQFVPVAEQIQNWCTQSRERLPVEDLRGHVGFSESSSVGAE